uniref:Retrotransposon protein, putative, unclassified n=2 Tax=Oryza sativa subsp. japonica TaxID=39947 RepID=Q60DA5_ORYSJ|nr:retrotransposon protein, putative, unclassified [Oryza sativa Japonica Group]AAX95588.1 hypothetical protein [Oryza sativa Japonica Group]ABF97748.1 retrotransposon protein, putative, unclassified [Oryza sativa Japonica Group]
MAWDDTTTGDRGLGRAIRGHLRKEDDDANSPVQETMTDDDVRRPVTSSDNGMARLDVDGGAPAVSGSCKGAAEVLLLRSNPTVATEDGGDGYSSDAARLERRRRGGARATWRRRYEQR